MQTTRFGILITAFIFAGPATAHADRATDAEIRNYVKAKEIYQAAETRCMQEIFPLDADNIDQIDPDNPAYQWSEAHSKALESCYRKIGLPVDIDSYIDEDSPASLTPGALGKMRGESMDRIIKTLENPSSRGNTTSSGSASGSGNAPNRVYVPRQQNSGSEAPKPLWVKPGGR